MSMGIGSHGLVSRRGFVALSGMAMGGAVAAGTLARQAMAGAAVSKATANAGTDAPTSLSMAWLPNTDSSTLESDENYQALKEYLAKGAGVPVEFTPTTDYNITVEAVASGNAQLAQLGAEGYVQAHAKNPAVVPLVVPAGKDGTLATAMYHSMICVPADQAAEYQKDGAYSLDNIKGKRISFVSTSSTSGFAVPTSQIVKHFGLDSSDELTREGFFSEVLFGDSHDNTLVSLCLGDCDVATFSDSLIKKYCELVEGEALKPGCVYRIRDDAAAPADRVKGIEFTPIMVIPVLNAPYVVNTEVVPQSMIDSLRAELCSDEVANDQRIFGEQGIYTTKSYSRFVETDDAWYDPIRKLEGDQDGVASSKKDK